jgi:hypothetical protein
MMVIFLPRKHISPWSKALLQLWRKYISIHFLCFLQCHRSLVKVVRVLNCVEGMAEGNVENFVEKEMIVSFFDTVCMSSCTLCVAIIFSISFLNCRYLSM